MFAYSNGLRSPNSVQYSNDYQHPNDSYPNNSSHYPNDGVYANVYGNRSNGYHNDRSSPNQEKIATIGRSGGTRMKPISPPQVPKPKPKLPAIPPPDYTPPSSPTFKLKSVLKLKD